MENPTNFDVTPSTDHRPLTWTWLALVVLTLLSLELGRWMHGVVLLQLVVAAIIWFKERWWHAISSNLTLPTLLFVTCSAYSSRLLRWLYC